MFQYAIFKDESVYFEEWIEYYKLVGIYHFFLFNNFSYDYFYFVICNEKDGFLINEGLLDWM
jgi:hypothetical protein